MRCFLAMLALAGALPLAVDIAPEANIRVAQMSRDVTDAVRKQRNEPRERSQTNDRTTREGKR